MFSSTSAKSLNTASDTVADTQFESQSLSLSPTRTLSYATYGPPTGYPLFFFHGFPSSRLEANGLSALACKRNLLIIAPDRPGFGGSTYQPNRRITDWPADVQALAEHLDIKRFAVLGGSGGGPYALACAWGLPSAMMSAVGLLSSSGPWRDIVREDPTRAEGKESETARLVESPAKSVAGTSGVETAQVAETRSRQTAAASSGQRPSLSETQGNSQTKEIWVTGTKDLPKTTWLFYFGVTYAPALTTITADGLVWLLRWLTTTGPLTRWIDNWLKSVAQIKRDNADVSTSKSQPQKQSPESEAKSYSATEDPPSNLRVSEARARLLRTSFEAFAQGSKATIKEAQLLSQEWGFRFEDVDYGNIKIWHGTKDVNAPVRMIRYMAERLPHCDFYESDDSHYTAGSQIEELLDELVPETKTES